MSSKLRFMPHEEGAGTKAQRKLYRRLQDIGLPCKWEHKITVKWNGKTFVLNIDIQVGRHDNLCVEVWGESHLIESQKRKDSWRKFVVERDGYKFKSFWDEEVEKDVDACVVEIVYALLGVSDVAGRG